MKPTQLILPVVWGLVLAVLLRAVLALWLIG
jgi:hypothetical protein